MRRLFLLAATAVLVCFNALSAAYSSPGTYSQALPVVMNSAMHFVNITGSANHSSIMPVTGAAGNVVAFLSAASNLVADDTNGALDAFVWERESNRFRRVSVADDGAQANGSTQRVWLSANGRYALFLSVASNLVPGDTNGEWDLFRRDLWNDRTELVSVTTGGTAGGWVRSAALAADGNAVWFTAARAMTDTPIPMNNPACDEQDGCTLLYRREMTSGVTTLALTAADGAPVAPIRGVFVSENEAILTYEQGQYTGQYCKPNGCIPQYGNVIWRREQSTGSTSLVASSVTTMVPYYESRGVRLAGISADGSLVAYTVVHEASSGSEIARYDALIVQRGEEEPYELYAHGTCCPPARAAPGDSHSGGAIYRGAFSASTDGSEIIFVTWDLDCQSCTPQFPDDDNQVTDLFHRSGAQSERLEPPVSTEAAFPALAGDARTLYYEGKPLNEPPLSLRTDIFMAQLP